MGLALKHSLLLTTLGLTLVACGGESDNKAEVGSPPPTANQTPQVTIVAPVSGPVASVRQGQSLTLTASATDSDGSIKGILWQQLAGPSLSLGDTTAPSLTLTPLPSTQMQPESYRFRVTVTDDKGANASADIAFAALRAMSANEASHLLHQGTMGPTMAEILGAKDLSEAEWLDAQMQQPATAHSSLLENYPGADEPFQINRIDAWWKATLHSPDQLRQRVTFALSEILVASDANNALKNEPAGMLAYYDILVRHAFGNFRELLEDVTLSPVMGTYLSHLGNEKADTALNIRPDENYAREVMQLFTIGLKRLNPDGTDALDANGNSIPTYGQEQITGFAHVFTGWTFGASARWNRPSRNFTLPMEPWEEYHSLEEKTLLDGTVLAAGQLARDDLAQALDNLFNHSNVGPFIGKQLIQRLVSSNPTPQYVARVSAVFDDNGAGVRGDLAAVVRAILLDDEARRLFGVLDYGGKIREPLLRTSQFWRELQAASASGFYFTWSLDDAYGQTPLGSPSVFNFFRPDYQSADLLEAGLLAPELQIANDAALIGQFNEQYSNLLWHILELTEAESKENKILLRLQPQVDILTNQGLEALLDYYSLLFYQGNLSSAQRQRLRDIQAIWATANAYQQLAYLLFSISVSPDYIVQD
jgi:uncharacterized protein (DUF1800 family)